MSNISYVEFKQNETGSFTVILPESSYVQLPHYRPCKQLTEWWTGTGPSPVANVDRAPRPIPPPPARDGGTLSSA